MEVSRPMEVARLEEIKILQDVRLIQKHDLNPVYSNNNIRVQFALTGELKGAVTCYLCLDGQELSVTERNYLYPLFVESMNILVGRQVSTDDQINKFRLKLSPPKLSMNSVEINTAYKKSMHKYSLELDSSLYCVLAEYDLEAIN